jgi:hypothetical protein
MLGRFTVPGRLAQELAVQGQDLGGFGCGMAPGMHVLVDACGFAGSGKRVITPLCLRQQLRKSAQRTGKGVAMLSRSALGEGTVHLHGFLRGGQCLLAAACCS